MNFQFRQRDQLTISMILGVFVTLLWIRSGLPVAPVTVGPVTVAPETGSREVINSGAGGMVDLDRASRRNFQYQVDLATASWTEFALLPGIGEALSKRMIDFRESREELKSVDELLEVKGIGPKKLASIRASFLPMPQESLREPSTDDVHGSQRRAMDDAVNSSSRESTKLKFEDIKIR